MNYLNGGIMDCNQPKALNKYRITNETGVYIGSP